MKKDLGEVTSSILHEVHIERCSQDNKWGKQDHCPKTRLFYFSFETDNHGTFYLPCYCC